jgi:hypothetical protein
MLAFIVVETTHVAASSDGVATRRPVEIMF